MHLCNRIHRERSAGRFRDRSTPALALLAFLLLASPAAAKELDFGAALQTWPTGTPVYQVVLDTGGFMLVSTTTHGKGPNCSVVFDSSDPTRGQEDLGTPNRDFGGPGVGRGGEEGAEGENAFALGKILVAAGDEDEDNGDDDDGDDEDAVVEPRAALKGGIVTLEFSHAGRLRLTIIDVDCNEDEPRIYLFHEKDYLGRVEAEDLGDNSVQTLDLSEHGDIDRVKIHMNGTTGIASIVLDVPTVGVESATWSGVKELFR